MTLSDAIALTLALFGSAGLAWSLGQLVLAKASRHWPRTRATVTHSSVVEDDDGEGGRSYKPHVQYRYEVDGTEYMSDRIAFGGYRTFTFRRSALRRASKYPVGAVADVAFDPSAPSNAVIEVGNISTALVAACVSSLLMAAGIAAVWFEFSPN